MSAAIAWVGEQPERAASDRVVSTAAFKNVRAVSDKRRVARYVGKFRCALPGLQSVSKWFPG
jgi:hypothetical protein